jgi:hypothetical protein
MEENVPAKISGNDKTEKANVTVKTWTPAEKRIRALKSLFTWWGIALVCVFIPLAHFILVPLFFIVGIIMPLSAYNKKSMITGGEGTCPFCSKPFKVAAAPDRWPLQDICENCHRHVRIEKSPFLH